MKKKVIVLSSCIVLLLIICFGVANREYPVLENSSESRNFNTNVISMMYETETGSGEYMVSSDKFLMNSYPLVKMVVLFLGMMRIKEF